jgi:DNA invertase Pin-like site-specific DNA recombinase
MQKDQPPTAPEEKPKSKAYSYIRMSTPEQLKGDSLRRQLARTRDYAEKHDLELIESFDDLGISAFRGNNADFGELARFKDLVDSGDIERGSYLIVESMDRLSRDKVTKAFARLSDIINKGIILVTLDDGQTYSEDTIENQSIQLYIVLGSMARAHEESRRKADLLSHTWIGKRERLRSAGTILTSKVPAWLRADRIKNEIVQIPERVEIIREVFDMTCGGYGAYSVAQHLNKRGIRPWGNRNNAVWRDTYIKKILASRTVLGEFQPHTVQIDKDKKRRLIPDGDPILGYYPAIISPQQFLEAAQAKASRRTRGGGRKGTAYANLLTGLLRCKCSAGMRYLDKGRAPKGGGQYLRCSVALAGGSCKARPYRYEIVESKVLHAIETLDVGKILGGNSRQQRLADLQHDLSMLHVDRDGINTKIARIVKFIEDGSNTSTSLKDALAKLEKERGECNIKIETAELEINDLTTISPKIRQEVIGSLLKKIKESGEAESPERIRRSLASELHRLIDRITIEPAQVYPDDVLEIDPKRRPLSLQTEEQVGKNLRQYAFMLKILYRNSDTQVIDGWQDVALKFKKDPRMKRLVTSRKINAERAIS